MAWLQKRGRYWWIGYRVHGKQTRRSTRTTKESEAKAILSKLELLEAARKQGALTAEFYEAVTGAEKKSIGAVEFMESWFRGAKPNLAESSAKKYQLAIREFTDHLRLSAVENIDEITARIITDYLAVKLEELGPKTVLGRYKTLRIIFKAAKVEKYITSDPMEGVRAPSTSHEPRIRRPFTMDELETLFAATDRFWTAMAKIGLYTGFRLGDCATLTGRNIDMDSGIIHYKQIEKTGKIISLPMSPSLQDELRKWVSGPGPIFPKEAELYKTKGQDAASASLSGKFRKILIKADLRPKRTKRTGPKTKRRTPGELSFHSLRHSFVTLLKSAGATSAVAMELAGHSSLAVNMEYTHLPPEVLREPIDLIRRF